MHPPTWPYRRPPPPPPPSPRTSTRALHPRARTCAHAHTHMHAPFSCTPLHHACVQRSGRLADKCAQHSTCGDPKCFLLSSAASDDMRSALAAGGASVAGIAGYQHRSGRYLRCSYPHDFVPLSALFVPLIRVVRTRIRVIRTLIRVIRTVIRSNRTLIRIRVRLPRIRVRRMHIRVRACVGLVY